MEKKIYDTKKDKKAGGVFYSHQFNFRVDELMPDNNVAIS